MKVLEANQTSGGYSWTLTTRLADMLEQSEKIYGPRDREYSIVGIEFEENGPQIWYPFSSEYIAIQLSKGSMDNMICGCDELAHESIHLFSPLGKHGANILEEGLATRFSIDYVQSEFNHTQEVQIESYKMACDLVDELLKIDALAIRKLRMVEPTISKFTESLIVQSFPSIDNAIAKKLCSLFDRDAT